MTIPTETTVITLLDTQNEVKTIAATPRDISRVSVKFEGDFSAGDIKVGYIDDSGTFRVASAGTASVDGDFIYTVGRNRRVAARATGVTPVINVETDLVE